MIPEMFTDATLGKERDELEKKIANAQRCVDNLNKEVSDARREVEECRGEFVELFARNAKRIEWENYGIIERQFKPNLDKWQKRLEAVNALLQKTQEQRAEDHYQELVNNMLNPGYNYAALPLYFRKMNGYKDSAKLADECENQYKRQKEEEAERENQRKSRQKRRVRIREGLRVGLSLTLAVTSFITFFLSYGGHDYGVGLIMAVIFLYIPWLIMLFAFGEFSELGERFVGYAVLVFLLLFSSFFRAIGGSVREEGILFLFMFIVFFVASCAVPCFWGKRSNY